MSSQRATQLVEAGLWLRLSGDREGARRLFEQALKLDPTNVRARQLLDTGPVPAAPSAAEGVEAPSRAAVPTRADFNPFMRQPGPAAPSPVGLDGESAGGPAPAPGSSAPSPFVPVGRPSLTGALMRTEFSEPRHGAIPGTRGAVGAGDGAPPPAGAGADDAPVTGRPATTAPSLPAALRSPAERAMTPGGVPQALTPAGGMRSAESSRPTLDARSAWDTKSGPGVSLSDRAPQVGAAMDLVAADEPRQVEAVGTRGSRAEVAALVRGARDLLELDDHSGALELLTKAGALAPDDAEVQGLRERCERTLQHMYESKLGPLEGHPRVLLKDDEIIWLNLDHRAGFVLAQIDGSVSWEDLFALSGMSRFDTGRILAQLLDEGVIAK